MLRIVALALAAASLATADLPSLIESPTGTKWPNRRRFPAALPNLEERQRPLGRIAPGLGTTATHHCGHAKPWHHLCRTARSRSAGVLEAQR